MSLRKLSGALAHWEPGRSVAGDPLHAIAAAWPAIVGENVAANSAPLALTGPTLTIATRSSAWSQQLQFLSGAVLQGVRALPQAAGVERLAFRSGALRRGAAARAGAAGRPLRRNARGTAPAPAADLPGALERLRERMEALQPAAGMRCVECGAPLEGERRPRCAPCGGAAEHAGEIALARSLYLAPWQTLAELRETMPDVNAAQYERVRRQLLQRWWLALERARRAGRLSPSRLERHVASSYVLLQSRLPPDRITPAVVRNLLGVELEALLWPEESRGPSARLPK